MKPNRGWSFFDYVVAAAIVVWAVPVALLCGWRGEDADLGGSEGVRK